LRQSFLALDCKRAVDGGLGGILPREMLALALQFACLSVQLRSAEVQVGEQPVDEHG
jgi:hypothetical protein